MQDSRLRRFGEALHRLDAWQSIVVSLMEGNGALDPEAGSYAHSSLTTPNRMSGAKQVACVNDKAHDHEACDCFWGMIPGIAVCVKTRGLYAACCGSLTWWKVLVLEAR